MLRKLLLISALLLGVASASYATENPQQQQLAMWRQVSFPLDNFTRFSSRFGWRSGPGGGGREFHSGLDMPAPTGSYLRAWADGQVVDVSYDSRCGNHVIIVSGDWRSAYCHLSAMSVKVGDYVQAGQVVAAVGSTGRSTGPHLHWTLRYQGQLVDPELVIRAMQTAWQGGSAPEIAPAQDVPETAQESATLGEP